MVIEFADSAISDLDEILAWYTEQMLPETGQRLIEEIITRVGQLETFPESGRIVPELGLKNVRECIHQPFRIVYRLEEKRVQIIRIWRSERLLKIPGGGGRSKKFGLS